VEHTYESPKGDVLRQTGSLDEHVTHLGDWPDVRIDGVPGPCCPGFFLLLGLHSNGGHRVIQPDLVRMWMTVRSLE
jgi:hypothetical protein